jgi:hypothetical protein
MAATPSGTMRQKAPEKSVMGPPKNRYLPSEAVIGHPMSSNLR